MEVAIIRRLLFFVLSYDLLMLQYIISHGRIQNLRIL